MSFHKIAAVALVLWLGVASSMARLPAVGALPPAPSSNCQRKCGDVYIPYPFGIGDDQSSPDHCAWAAGFYVSCKGNAPFVANVELLNISLQGQARVMNSISSYCYCKPKGPISANKAPPAPVLGGGTGNPKLDDPGNIMKSSGWFLDLTNCPYRFSDSQNKFTVIGCRMLAYISDEDDVGRYMSGCVSVCVGGNVSNAMNGFCSGIGCCQTAIPTDLQYYKVLFDPRMNTTGIYNETPCSYAVLMDSSSFTFSTSYLTSTAFNNSYGRRRRGQVPLVLDWAIRDASSCEEAKKHIDSYACVSNNSICLDSRNGPGYFCNCSKGYRGNPYLQGLDGCIDINECNEESNYPCYGVCKNTPGGFNCSCHPGFQGIATIQGGCQKEPVGTLTLRAKLAIGKDIF
uniref:EGF-like domain-containing protein n=1 Tax=Oryza nivara TaxID=4536 RepID=A0A0E0GZR0_ORYNI